MRPKAICNSAQHSTERQRTEIYAIQKKYNAQIADLRKQLDALLDKQAAEIDAVLTAEQKSKIAELQAEAKELRAIRERADEGRPAPQTPEPVNGQ